MDERDSESNGDGERRPFRPFVCDRPQRPEHGCAQDEGKAKSQTRVGKTLVLTTPRILRLEEPHLPKQRTRHRELYRDYGLEKLNGDVHDPSDSDGPGGMSLPATLLSAVARHRRLSPDSPRLFDF
jgi:hypothetical protein